MSVKTQLTGEDEFVPKCEGCGTLEGLRLFSDEQYGGLWLCPEHWLDPEESALQNAAIREDMERAMLQLKHVKSERVWWKRLLRRAGLK